MKKFFNFHRLSNSFNLALFRPLRPFPFRDSVSILGIQEIDKVSETIINSSNFEAEVLNSDKPVLVDFWATWCGPCRMLAPIISQIAVKYDGSVKVAKIDVDELPELAEAFNVSSIPTLVLFKDGKPVATRVGGASMGVVEAFIDANV